MNAVLAKNVKTMRLIKHWTQQHLADTAGIQLRTVQRVEKGDGASLDTLGALSNALDASIDELQLDVEALVSELRQVEEEFSRSHYIVDVASVTCSADLERIGGSQAYFFHCNCGDDAVRDTFAALSTNLTDIGEIWDDVETLEQRAMVKGAYEQVEGLGRLGVAVSIGKGSRTVRMAGVTGDLLTFYVVAWPKGEERNVIAIEKCDE